ncbi:UDP-N-acetylmuramoyl-L-alanine--D-glutamate ligase [Bifidobacterium gallicum]|uniref:UDP-N-acetylmuramoylalanine--D-glutamate ligase n=1 Tax=Bifidobacterium gallicum DSM 20093 = LMG 11596 TaxID=561180 RepID=D1NSX0_9BIFI|nr:UDP-N-acetylmuramoyl-L-alanine--D-glutamate ligase [Bifidobacterium gallicum]EFA23772.1 UDP-N-acetylmuramoyl-L-alanine--D-glutamate ligase [Bifidobacterium gallicum DSM 20093 = LMG 11596]KFI59216.1 UDP-N-acetylmuramoylalanine--D-glutamate ligase [Bifidobacterium gallicum DSM 20093 = LMG 11596]
MQCADKTFVVAGLGVSGRAMAQVLRERGAHVITVDERNGEADRSSFDGIDWKSMDALCVSPVFPPRTPFILAAQEAQVPVLSEVELAWQLRVPNTRTGKPAPWIGITGTNGKTSTTEMVSTMLTACGYTAPAVGNIGNALSLAAVDPNNDVLCVELSSFQLHFTDSMALDCAAITNIGADHLDWHGGIERYAADKSKVYAHAQQAIVYNAQDARVRDLAFAADASCARIGFTLDVPQDGMIGVADGWIVDRAGLMGSDPATPVMVAPVADFTHLREPDGTVYPHLLADAMTALAWVLSFGADAAPALEALKTFKPGGHRIECVAQYTSDEGAIRFIDDSKATNAGAAAASLGSFGAHTVSWIAGGLAKGGTFEQLVADNRDRLVGVTVIGVDQEPMLKALLQSAPDVPVSVIDAEPNDTVMARAVDAAAAYAKPGDVVLMAPACASMDQFVSYADRGNQFAQEAQRWVVEHGQS